MNRGDVVEVDWPFTDLTGTKPRPAIVVQADFLNGLIDDMVLVKVQSNSFGIPGTEVRIDPAIEKASSLVKVCYVSCRDLLTRDQALILRSVGSLWDGNVACSGPIDRGVSDRSAQGLCNVVAF